ncbi:unnamed protein product [Prorocentrum cordatum]|uniref:Uncharacterized protein n=1 Tax=Prorocentrum cordatum TaxID=2364126 RepID=A0ABN9PSS1_9DINO|nr:unnamed protein product [Polarella glacialis]
MITNLHLKFVRAVNIASGRALDDDNSGKLRAFPPTERGDINLVGLYITLPLRGSCIGSSMGAVRAPLRGSGLFGVRAHLFAKWVMFDSSLTLVRRRRQPVWVFAGRVPL